MAPSVKKNRRDSQKMGPAVRTLQSTIHSCRSMRLLLIHVQICSWSKVRNLRTPMYPKYFFSFRGVALPFGASQASYPPRVFRSHAISSRSGSRPVPEHSCRTFGACSGTGAVLGACCGAVGPDARDVWGATDDATEGGMARGERRETVATAWPMCARAPGHPASRLMSML